ncbi:MAG: hypothetical protein ACKV2V_01160 [Blastocatellia bacterium]
MAGGSTSVYGLATPYAARGRHYYPAGPRDTAAEIRLTSGEEARNIDIRWQGERGAMVSGRILG